MLYFLRQKKVRCYDFIKSDDKILCIATEKLCRFDIKERIAHRCGVNALVFSSVSNEVRRKIHEDCTRIIQFKYADLIRADIDSITLLINDCVKSALFINKLFICESKILKYKLECDEIKRVISYSKRSYSLEFKNQDEGVYKCCGLQLSYQKRFNEINLSLMANNFKESIHKLKYNHFNTFNPPSAIPIKSETYTNSAYGLSHVFKCMCYGNKLYN